MPYPESTSCGEIGCILHIILNHVLPFKTDGTFIEIGANDGKTGSFTYNLAEIGWNGLNFEPIPRLYDQCCLNHKNHKNVKNFQIGIGDTSTEATIIDANTLSTIDVDTIKSYENTPQFSAHFNKNNAFHTIKIEKLDTMLEKTNTTDIDIMVLDVEGYEEKVLSGFTIETYKPKIFIIEICDQHPDFINNEIIMGKCKNVRKYFNEHNYFLLVNDVVDNVYVNSDIYNNLTQEFIRSIKSAVKFPQFTS